MQNSSQFAGLMVNHIKPSTGNSSLSEYEKKEYFLSFIKTTI